MSLKKILSLSLGLVILATVAVLISTGTVGAQSLRLNPIAAAPPTPSVPVNVVNTPLAVTGSVNANVNGATVNANITGTPTVNANVSTSATSPLYVDTDEPARNGFDASCDTPAVDPTYGQASCTLFTIPAGREVVIESVSCHAFLVTGNIPGQANIIMTNYSAGPFPSGYGVYYDLALNKTGSQSGLDLYQLMTPFRMYGSAPPGGSIDVGIFYRTNPSSTYPQELSCAVTGHIVP